MATSSASQIDKLGVRLRAPLMIKADLFLLDEYRNSFAPASSEVLSVLRRDFQLEPTARPAKSTRAIIAKLHREGTRLSTMQDVAGCRVVVPSRKHQRVYADGLRAAFADHRLVDRLVKPSHGYRALHLVVKLQGRWVEIQLRTELQHLWAQLCELMADRLGPDIKYGGGDAKARQLLDGLSMAVDFLERQEEGLLFGGGDNLELTLFPDLPPMRLDRQALRALLESTASFLDISLKGT
jgi:putative GTP pyrophosphokinase